MQIHTTQSWRHVWNNPPSTFSISPLPTVTRLHILLPRPTLSRFSVIPNPMVEGLKPSLPKRLLREDLT